MAMDGSRDWETLDSIPELELEREEHAAMKHFLLFYEVGPDYVERRAQHRNAHLEKAWASHARGELQLAGALADPVDGAVLLFRGEASNVAESFARVDPYVVNGLVRSWHVREWSTVAGEGAATPVRPDSSSTASR